jgi:hypothetical protein
MNPKNCKSLYLTISVACAKLGVRFVDNRVTNSMSVLKNYYQTILMFGVSSATQDHTPQMTVLKNRKLKVPTLLLL